MSIVTPERIQQAIRTLAELISSGHERLWPILERLEAERDALLDRRERLARYVDTPANAASGSTELLLKQRRKV
jgi:hypothetical protein